MTKIEPLTIYLPEPLAREVMRVVERGGYSEPADVVAAALNDWIDRGSPPAMTTARMRELVAEAEQAGEEDRDFDIEEIIAESRTTDRPKR